MPRIAGIYNINEYLALSFDSILSKSFLTIFDEFFMLKIFKNKNELENKLILIILLKIFHEIFFNFINILNILSCFYIN